MTPIASPPALGPFIENPIGQGIVIVAAYAVTLGLSSLIVGSVIKPKKQAAPTPPTPIERHTPMIVGDKKDAPIIIYAGSASVTTANDPPPPDATADAESRADTGKIIGRCENLLVVTLVLFNQFPALAIIFAAKGIVRQRDIARDANYYLGGTLVNFTWSVLVAALARTLCFGLG